MPTLMSTGSLLFTTVLLLAVQYTVSAALKFEHSDKRMYDIQVNKHSILLAVLATSLSQCEVLQQLGHSRPQPDLQLDCLELWAPVQKC